MKKHILLSFMAAALVTSFGIDLFSPKGDSVEDKRAKARKDRDEILAKLYGAQPGAKEKIKNAAGYATFNNKNLNLFLLSSGRGYGIITDKSGKETFMSMGSLGGGVGAGIKDLSVVFIFKNADTMKQFIESGWQFGGEADASAKAGGKGGRFKGSCGRHRGQHLRDLPDDRHRCGAPGHRRRHQILER